MSQVEHIYRGPEIQRTPIFERDNHCVVYLCSLWSVDVHVGTT